MEKKSYKLKKTIASLILMTAIALGAALVGHLLVLAVTTDAMNVDWDDWVHNRNYEDSWTLTSHIDTDMGIILNYIGLKQRLEDADGTLNLDRPALVVQNEDGSISRYSMADLVEEGEDRGIYVYDGLTSWSQVADWSEGSGASPEVKVLWSLMEREDAAAGVNEDIWAVREQKIQEVTDGAQENAGEEENVGEEDTGIGFRVPQWDELKTLPTDDLIALARRLSAEYSDADIISEDQIFLWEQQMTELRENIQNDGTSDFYGEKKEPEIGEDIDEGETVPTPTASDDSEPYTVATDGGEYGGYDLDSDSGLYLIPGEEGIRQELRDCLGQVREYQKEQASTLYKETRSFLIGYLQDYYICRNIVNGTDSNLSWRITLEKNGVKKVYSDSDTAENQTITPGTDWNVYYFYDSATRRIETTLQSWSHMPVLESPVSVLKNLTCLEYGRVSVQVGLDTENMAYKDEYSMEAVSYGNYRGQVFGAVGVIIGCMAAALAAMVWLMFLSGHKDGVEGIYLNGYDRIPTEPAALGICVIAGGAVCMGWLAVKVVEAYESFDRSLSLVLLGGCVSAAVLLAYLSLWLGFYGVVRRLKAHTFLRNSLAFYILRWCLKPVRWCGRQLKKLWDLLLNAGDTTWKTLAVFCAYFVINFVWGLSLRYASALSMLLYLTFNAAVAVVLVWKSSQLKQIHAGVKKIADGSLDYHLPLDNLNGEARRLAVQINRISVGLKNAIEASVKNERMKTDLITNVSHDIKTPLTSIINYVDLLKRENIQDPKIRGYIDVLDKKSQRLKTLTEDLVEASKASSGTLKLSLEKIDFVELINQTNGEFTDRFEACSLNVIANIPEESAYIMADGRYVWRILENLYRNAEKYAMPGTRIYIDVFEKFGRIFFVMKNVSQAPLNIKADELTERFIRGDVSRSTEGSGLGLSIAKDMTELMNGTFKIYLDGDLFRVTVSFALIPQKKPDLKEMEENIRRKVAEEEAKRDGGASVFPDEKSVSGQQTETQKAPDFEESTDRSGRRNDRIRIELPRLRLPGRKKKQKSESGAVSPDETNREKQQQDFLDDEFYDI